MEQQSLVVVEVAAFLLLAFVFALAVRARHRRQARIDRIRRRYGAEFDRTSERLGSDRKAADDLEERERRHDRLALRRLDAADERALRHDLGALQQRFVDEPEGVLHDLAAVTQRVLRARGYPIDADREEGLAQLAIDHPQAAQPLRRLVTEPAPADLGEQRELFLSVRSGLEELGAPATDAGAGSASAAAAGGAGDEPGAEGRASG